MSEWIPVTDRLPEPYDPVLVYTDNGEMEVTYCTNAFGGEWLNTDLICFQPLFWMPLPEPPEDK